MNVLSLFDGISCGRIALERAGINVDNYYASEIDKYAMQISQKNYPDIVQLGSVTEWKIWDLPKIDLLIGGSPCQGFSVSGGGFNFEDPRSKLFFEFENVLKSYQPRYFLLENVNMKKEWKDTISEHLGVQPVEINSALVSAQNRKRLYWTNIPSVTKPENKHILLEDIIDSGFVDRDKSYCLDAHYYKGGSLDVLLRNYKEKKRRQIVLEECVQVGEASEINGHDILKRVYSTKGKSPTLNSMGGGNREPKITEDNQTWRVLTPVECERLQTIPDGYTEGVSKTQRYKMLGNGWTVDVIAHIFSFIPTEE